MKHTEQEFIDLRTDNIFAHGALKEAEEDLKASAKRQADLDSSLTDMALMLASALQEREELLFALQDMVALVKSRCYPQPDKPLSDWGRAVAAEKIIKKVRGQ